MTQAATQTPKQQRQSERKRLKLASLSEQLAWWASTERIKEGFQKSILRAECKRVQKSMSRLSLLVPSMRWYDDARSLPVDKGGEFPPKDEQGVTLMVKALGETRYYPPPYITSSGHSFDTYVEAVYTGNSSQLHEDGYNGGRVTLHQMTARDRNEIRRKERLTAARRGRGKLITNVF